MTIWIHTLKTYSALITEKGGWMVLSVLSILFGLCFSLDQASYYYMGDLYSTFQIILISLLVGMVIGPIYWLLTSLILFWLGQLFGGCSSSSWKDMAVVVAWSGIPFISKLILWILSFILFGQELFLSKTPELDSSAVLILTYWTFLFFKFVLTSWYFWLLIKGIGFVHDFSIWKALPVFLIGMFILRMIFYLSGLTIYPF
ncbi:hypothetical protein GXN76_00630 [Kroppenstedtia pulmonis]|uniref:Yip1 domain-containing protein n=1 Tax=Kroppenstedtia pulmonis TaxID=1380685 RepID=A0A7D3XQ16_9BACL|nr:YIP1 family protein [Kroppenstedtia pulmonis]QKG83108.1 hypothetical protein GXN76_00630 [Kroppenstedtia pulmonis]